MTSPRQKKKKLAILKMLKKQKHASQQQLEKTAVENMNKNLLKGSEKHATDLIDQKQSDSNDKLKNALKEIKNKKTVKQVEVEQSVNTDIPVKSEESDKVNDT